MSDIRRRINQLKQANSELAKEILLNESAIYEAEREIADLDEDLLDHPLLNKDVDALKERIRAIEAKNRFEIKRLEEHEKDE